MALTQTQIDEAIARVLLNGETWETGDIRSHLSLERLLEARERVVQNSNPFQFTVAAFDTPVSENE